MNKALARFFFSFSICLLLSAAVSCSKTDQNVLFQQKLDAVDALIQGGNGKKAAVQLRKLRKRAQLPMQYLSIVKRELRIESKVQALQTIQAGLKKHPDDSMLKAVLVHTLLKETRIREAAEAAHNLYGTAYAGIGAEAFIQADKINSTYLTPVDFWKEGFRLTGEHIFLENAGLLLARQGDIKSAAALRNSISREDALRSPYFWSCLAYDTGNFAPVLKELFYSLVYADMAGLPEHNPKAFEYARRHILLAADASAGMGDTDQARSFWQMYVDRYPESASDVFYNLAMTAPTEQEKIENLIDCITREPGYYPAVAQYVRAWSNMTAANAKKTPLTELLQSKDFFSLEMEKSYFLSAAFTLTAEQVLENAAHTDYGDPRFMLEGFRYKYAQPKNYAQGNGEMWKMLEKDSSTPLIKSYARWYFAGAGDFNACFSIEKTDDPAEDLFYDGVRHAVQGSSLNALKSFQEAEHDARYECPAVVNQAYIYDARNEPDMAIRYFTRAEKLVPDTVMQSKMLYEAARILSGRNGIADAVRFLNRALELDPENRRARVLRQKLSI